MPRKARGRRRTLQPGVQKHKIRSKNFDEEGILDLLEQFIPQTNLHRLFNLAEKSFQLFTKINCKLCLIPYSLSDDGKLEPISRTKLWIHYLVLSVLAVSMMHKLIIFIFLISSGTLDTETFFCGAVSLCYVVAFSLSSSTLILPEETMDMINGWPKILMHFPDEDGKVMLLVANTKTAVVILEIAILMMVIASAGSGFSIVFRALPVTILVAAETAGLITTTSEVPRIVWKSLFWPLEFIMYGVPLLQAGWGGMVTILLAMVLMNCTNQMRYIPTYALRANGSLQAPLPVYIIIFGVVGR